MNEWVIKKMNEVMTYIKENARIKKKSDMVIGMEDYVMMKERMTDLFNGFKDKWIVKNMIECMMNWWVNDT